MRFVLLFYGLLSSTAFDILDAIFAHITAFERNVVMDVPAQRAAMSHINTSFCVQLSRTQDVF